MPTTDQLRTKLIEKLQELFQLDQPELDFGFYRIMHAKAEQVQRFLENDLLTEVQQAFADGSAGKQGELKSAYEDALAQAKKFGAPDPENAPAVQEAKGRYTDALDTTKAEAEVYDHLYRFFERYYEDGDFVSRRYLTRETPGKAAPYAVPYDGQEVMLHWANRDQYYIKTSEHFNTYTFEARAAAQLLREEAKKNKDQAALELENVALEGEPLRVHFRIVEAAEGEHNNVKESADKKRYFIVDGTEPLAFNEAGELQCRFTYRQDPEKTGQENTWKQARNKRNEEALLGALAELAKTDKRAAAYLPLLKLSAPRGAKKDERTLLGKYIEKYTATNSKDYFIHKDLGGFLRRELDFYLKNEVMRLDDIENAEAPKVEHYLAKLRTIRRIAHKLTDFLAQLENFQKRLWLKKKFVVETNYCITLDRVPEVLYPAIAKNAAQKAEWEKLFSIQDLPNYEAKKPLTVDFLKANPYLVLDTAFLTEAEKAQLLVEIDDFDAQCNGLLVHSENFQALRMLEGRYREQVKCVYIDPPYNTEKDRAEGKFIYKDSFTHSSWLALLNDRLALDQIMRASEYGHFVSIDENELHHLITLPEVHTEKYHGVFTWKRTRTGGHLSSSFNQLSDYVTVTTSANEPRLYGGKADPDESQPITKAGNKPKDLCFPIGTVNFLDFEEGSLTLGTVGKGESPVTLVDDCIVAEHFNATLLTVNGPFTWTQATLDSELARGARFIVKKANNLNLRCFRESLRHKPFPSQADDKFTVGTNEDSSQLMSDLLGRPHEDYAKPVQLVKRIVMTKSYFDPALSVLDYFAGSGTTGHAVVELNREDNAKEPGSGRRNYILVEMGDYFDTVTRLRMQKVVYSQAWKDGKPMDRKGVSHCFKYIRLESYEDTLNALELRTDAEREKLLAANKGLREDYTLRYLLDVETQGSASLLNHTAFADPRAYTLTVKKPGSEESTTKAVDLLETFNYLLGMRVQHIEAPETFTATFERVKDEEVAKDQPMRLAVKGNLKPAADGPHWFRKVQGWMPRDRHKPHGEREKVLIIWRTLTDDLEKDNAVLDTYFTKNRIAVREQEYDVIYVNGSNNLPNLWQQGDRWKVRLIEEDFHRLMWEGVEDLNKAKS